MTKCFQASVIQVINLITAVTLFCLLIRGLMLLPASQLQMGIAKLQFKNSLSNGSWSHPQIPIHATKHTICTKNLLKAVIDIYRFLKRLIISMINIWLQCNVFYNISNHGLMQMKINQLAHSHYRIVTILQVKFYWYATYNTYYTYF